MAFNLNSVEQMQICRALCSTTSQCVAGIGSSDDYAAMLADPVSCCSRLLLLLLLLTDTSSSPPWLVPAPTSDFADRLFLMWPPLLLLLHARRPASWLVGCGAKQLALAVSMVLPVSIADRFVLWPSLPQRCAYTRLIHWWTTDPQGYTNSPQIWLCCVTNCMNYCRPMTAHQNINITRHSQCSHKCLFHIHIHMKFKTRVKNSKSKQWKTHSSLWYVQGCKSSRLLYNQSRPKY